MDSVMSSPKVTVLMPVYNGEKYLRDAIDSILCQNFTDFEFLIINDGSTDGSQKIIDSYLDKRIKVLNNEKNIGLVNTLNKGFNEAQGEYIVRMDCDDVSLKNRLSVQVAFMDKNKTVGASGSYYYLLLNEKKALADFPLNQEEMKCFMIFNSPIAHPTAIIRASVIKENKLSYRSECIHAEDYDFWSQMSQYSELANVSDVLLNYRVHPNQITGNAAFLESKNKTLNAIRLRHLKQMDIIPTEMEMNIHHLISNGEKAENEQIIVQSELWLKKLQVENQKNNKFDEAYLGKIILERWLRMCFNFYGGRKGFQCFINSELYGLIKLPLRQKLEFFKNLYNSYKRKSIKS